METFTVSACGNQFTGTALPSPVKGRTELLSSTRSCEVSSLYLPLAMARTSRIPAGLLNSPTISLKEAVFLTGQRSFTRPPNFHPTLLVNSARWFYPQTPGSERRPERVPEEQITVARRFIAGSGATWGCLREGRRTPPRAPPQDSAFENRCHVSLELTSRFLTGSTIPEAICPR
jgi:hypothetical protein